jgi:hypothetical protein
MNRKDFEKMIEMMHSLIDMRKSLESNSGCDDCDENEEESDEDDECPISKEIADEYEAIMIWAFGNKYGAISRADSILIWQKLHPKLELPRILKSKHIAPMFHGLALILDVLPLYLKEKTK